jgi:HEPN domain-containing protein
LPQDSAHVVATQAWFIKAKEDLREAEFVLTAAPPFVGSSLYHSGQAVEKALKGFLTWRQITFLTDDLEQLRSQCAEVDTELADALQGIDQLSEYGWRFRYPNDLAEPSFDQATETLRFAAHAVRAVLARVVADAQRQ